MSTRTVNSTADNFDYVDTSETVARITTGSTVTDSIVSPAGDRFGVKVGATLNWFIPDLHGDVAGSWDSSEATVVNAIRYDAWGQTLASGSAGGSAVGTGLWKYQGRLDVSPSGLATPLYDMSARFYSPGIGAFTQSDSVMGSAGDPLSMNRFLYAEGDPTTLIDPSGHMVACATSDLCDESQAVRYRGSAGGREARIRSHLRDHGGYRDNGRGNAWVRRSERGRKYQVTHDPDAIHQAKLDALKGADQLAAQNEDALERFEGARNADGSWDLPDLADQVPEADKERVGIIHRYERYLLATGQDEAASEFHLRINGAMPQGYADFAGDPSFSLALAGVTILYGGGAKEGIGVGGSEGSADSGKTYQTYTKPSLDGGQPYSGRTSGTGTPEANVAARDLNHHMNEHFGPAQLDKSSTNAAAIRGREQINIDRFGGAQSMGGTSGNRINGVSPTNEQRSYYLDEARRMFGEE